MMTEKERNRFFRKATHPFLGLGFSPQIILIESCISEKTPVAPINKKMKPMNRSKGGLAADCGMFDHFL